MWMSCWYLLQTYSPFSHTLLSSCYPCYHPLLSSPWAGIYPHQCLLTPLLYVWSSLYTCEQDRIGITMEQALVTTRARKRLRESMLKKGEPMLMDLLVA